MTDSFFRHNTADQDKRLDTELISRQGLDYHQLRVRQAGGPSGIHGDAAGRQRVSQITTLFDGKVLGADDTRAWENAGTGTFTFQQNKMLMSVTAGQYAISQSRHFNPYFSGKSHGIEATCDNFHSQAGVSKRLGYFSSNAVVPFNTSKDGFWVEDDGTTKNLVVERAGTQVLSLPMSQWDASLAQHPVLDNYNWQNFTVLAFDFLWLGGTALRLFLFRDGEFHLLHRFNYAGISQDCFIQSPNQPVRYEIRSSSGAGTFRRICSSVFTEGSIAEEGDALSLITTAAIPSAAVGTFYAVKGVRKLASSRDIHTDIISFGGNVLSSAGQADAGRFLLCLNPTLSAPLTWTTNSRLEEGTATTQTVTNLGRVLQVAEASGAGVSQLFPDNALSDLRMSLTNVPDEIILVYQPYTTNQSVHGHITVKED